MLLWKLVENFFGRLVHKATAANEVFDVSGAGDTAIAAISSSLISGATLEEARSNLKEALELVLEANRSSSEESLKGKRVIREPFPIAP